MSPAPKIRLFVDAHCFDKEHQGIRTFIKRLYLELWKTTPAIELYFGAKDLDNLREEFKEIKGCRFVQYRFDSTLARLMFEIPLLVREHKIDVAHFQYISPFIKNCRQVVTTHDVLFNDFKSEFPLFYRLSRNLLFKRSLKRADVITTVSPYSKESIHKHFGIAPGSIHITPNSIGGEFFEAFDKAVSQKYISNKFQVTSYLLYVSRFEPRKSQVLLLQAYLDLKLYQKGYHLVFLGHMSIKTPAFDALLTSIPQQVRQFIMVNERVNDADLYHFYRGAELFIYPSRAEGFGLPPVEVGALKVPVICSNTTAMNDFSFFGEYHLDPTDGELLREKIMKLIDEGADAAHLEAVSRKIFSQYSSVQQAAAFRQALSSCIPLD